MLEKPDLVDDELCSTIESTYGINVASLRFLPLGADSNTAVYRVDVAGDEPYFLKLRGGPFDPASVLYPKHLSDSGLTPIIAPIPTLGGEAGSELSGTFGHFKTILYPYVSGQNGYEVRLDNAHWAEFGATLRTMHDLDVPADIQKHVAVEDYSPRWRDGLTQMLAILNQGAPSPEPVEGGRRLRQAQPTVENEQLLIDKEHASPPLATDNVGREAAAFLQARSEPILAMIERTTELARVLKAQPAASIVCHADLHAGNMLLGEDGRFYLVDWDTLKLARKERDLMYVGGGLMANHRTPEEEEQLFYAGYGDVEIDWTAMAYYRFERIIEDIAIYSQELVFSEEGGADREPALLALTSNFEPGHTIDRAYAADRR